MDFPRPEFNGDPRNGVDLDAYIEALQAWEDRQETKELSKAESDSPLKGLFDEALGDKGPQFIEGPTGPSGAPGKDGVIGVDGADGATGDTGAQGIQGDAGAQGAQGDQGDQGIQGDAGATGSDGADGNDWRVAAGAPSIIAGDDEGDLYLNSTNGDVYQVQSASWALVDNITGATGSQGVQGDQGIQGDAGAQGAQGDQGIQGDAGATGSDGADGNDWRVAAGSPSIIAGDDEDDLYLDSDTGDVYQVQSAAWVLVANIKGDATPQTYIRVTEATAATTLAAGAGAGTLTTIGFDTEAINTDTDNYSLASDEITVALAGDYHIQYSISWLGSTSGRRQVRAALQKDPGSGYVNLGKSFHWEDGDGTEIFTSQGFTIVALAAGDKIRLTGQRNVGTMTTTSIIAHQHIAITKLDTSGGGGGGGGGSVQTYIRLSTTVATTLGSGTGGGTAKTILFDTVDVNTDTGNFSLASNEITVADAGEYRLDYLITWDQGTAGRRTLRLGAEHDPGTGFVLLLLTFQFVDGDATDSQSNVGYTILTLGAGDKVRLNGQRNNGTMTTRNTAVFSQFTLTKIA